MNLCVIGTGYVGLVGAAVFSDWGNNVVGVDIDEKKIKMIESGRMPIFEPGLSEIVERSIKDKRLKFTTSLKEGMKNADIVFVCVGTPQGDNGRADLSAVWIVSKEIAKYLDDYKVIVTKSTVPVGTNKKVKQVISENLKNKVEFDVASNPEFLREGYSVEDMQNPDRTVVGVETKKSEKLMAKLYSHLKTPVVMTDLASAEMIKYASNAFLATKISFINEVANVCEEVGANVSEVAYGMGLDERVGSRFLRAGTGYGGSCFPKDVSALYRFASDNCYDFQIVKAVMGVNKDQSRHFTKKIKKYYGDLSGKTIGVLGLSFKENTDDIRDSVALNIVEDLRGLGAKLRVFDYEAVKNAKNRLGDQSITYCEDEYGTCEKADGLIVATEWKPFKKLDYKKIKSLLKKAVIFDSKNCLDKDEIEKLGYDYFGVGINSDASEKLKSK